MLAVPSGRGSAVDQDDEARVRMVHRSTCPGVSDIPDPFGEPKRPAPRSRHREHYRRREVPVDEQDALLRTLADEHGPDLFRFVVRQTRDRELAEDIVQETLARAWRNPGRIAAGRDAARAWLFTVARNLVIDDARSAHKRRELGVEEVPERPVDDGVDAVLDRMLVADALGSLSRDHRLVIVEAHYLGHSIREIAEQEGIAEGTVKSRLHYGMRALRLALQERGVTR
jgi:RNA polymerase sigma-70 factor (ECF subfamily)